MLHNAVIQHRLPGRTRLKLEGLKGQAALMAPLSEALRQCPSVMVVEANTTLGTMLVRHTGEWESVARWAEERALLNLSTPTADSINQRLRAGVNGLARDLGTLSGQPVDLGDWLTVGLIGLAIHQAVQGNVMVPAVSLLWYAFNNARMGESNTAAAPGQAPTTGEKPVAGGQ